MKIAYLVTRSDNIGGAQVHVRVLAAAMRRAGHDAWVVVGGTGPFTETLKADGIPCLSLRHLTAPISPWHDLHAVGELRRAFRELGSDIVSTHSSKAGVLGRFAARSVGIPVVFTAHGWSFTPGVPRASAAVYRLMERLAAPLAARIITVSEFDRQLAIRRRVSSAARLVTVHNGMPDVPAELRADPATTPVRLAMVARFEPQKDHETLFRALAGVKDLAWTIDLIGDGPLMPGAQARCRELGLGERVRFLGAVPDVTPLLAAVQVFLLISNWEGFPRSILEAMRAGLPVVASRVGGVAEAVQHGGSGFLAPRQDEQAVAAALRALLPDAELRSRLGAQGRALFESRFHLSRTMANTLQVYAEVLGGSPEVVPSPLAPEPSPSSTD